MYTITEDQAYETLVTYGIATEDEIALVTSINGNSLDTYESILFSRIGHRTFEQLNEAE